MKSIVITLLDDNKNINKTKIDKASLSINSLLFLLRK